MARFPNRLVTKRLVLRPPTLDDAAGVLAAVTASYPELHRWMPWAKEPYGIEQARAFCADSQAKLKEGVDFTTLLTLRESGTIIGSSGLMSADPAVPSFEIGYWLHTGHTGKGYVHRGSHRLDPPRLRRLRCQTGRTQDRRKQPPQPSGGRTAGLCAGGDAQVGQPGQ